MIKAFSLTVIFLLTLAICDQAFSSEVNTNVNPTNQSSSKNEQSTSAKSLAPFKAQYKVYRQGKSVGNAVRQLTLLDNGLAEYAYNTKLKLFIFSDKRNEKSIIHWQDSRVTPTEYSFKREGTGKDKHYLWQYDIPAGKAVNLKSNTTHQLDFPKGVQDKLSYHFKHRLALMANPEQTSFSYPVITTSGKIKDYQYQYDGKEQLKLPYGELSTIRLKREVKDKERITYAWFAPELDYLMVKIRQIKEGSEQFEARLTNYTITP